jgi:hypothetical protein
MEPLRLARDAIQGEVYLLALEHPSDPGCIALSSTPGWRPTWCTYVAVKKIAPGRWICPEHRYPGPVAGERTPRRAVYFAKLYGAWGYMPAYEYLTLEKARLVHPKARELVAHDRHGHVYRRSAGPDEPSSFTVYWRAHERAETPALRDDGLRAQGMNTLLCFQCDTTWHATPADAKEAAMATWEDEGVPSKKSVTFDLPKLLTRSDCAEWFTPLVWQDIHHRAAIACGFRIVFGTVPGLLNWQIDDDPDGTASNSFRAALDREIGTDRHNTIIEDIHGSRIQD